MRRLWTTLMAGALALAVVSGSAFAEDVFVTKRGKKYHKEGSRFIKNRDVEKLTREEAEARGYKPSSDFLKEDVAEEVVAEEAKQETE